MDTTKITRLGSFSLPSRQMRPGYIQGRFDYVFELATDDEKNLLLTLSAGWPVRKCSAKIRCWDYNAGDDTCANMDWHYDIVPGPEVEPIDEVHRIWVSGSPPEFRDIGRIDAETIYEYGRVEHRALPIKTPGPRLFARVSYSPTKRGPGNFNRLRGEEWAGRPEARF